MGNSVSTLIIPVESQVRELDAKILLSCVAAERGFPVIMGSRAYAHFELASIPRGVYLAKSMRSLSNTMFRIVRQLGHEIVAWEEEALVHPPADTYFTLRLSPTTIKNVSHVFAWGAGKCRPASAVSGFTCEHADPHHGKSPRRHTSR